MNIKFVPNLFLEVVELEMFKRSLDQDGFRKNLLQNTEKYGLIQNLQTDPLFLNGKIQRDLDDSLLRKTIKVNPLSIIDQFGRFIYHPLKSNIPIPNDGNWYWVKASYAISNKEKGIFSIDPQGNLVGSSDAELTKIFRGQPNFPTRIRFSNSTLNTLEYDVLEVVDDQNAILQHPALNQTGINAFEAESNLSIEIIGTFTPGVAVPNADKKPFEYDFAQITLQLETSQNTRPTYVSGSEFYLARVRVEGESLIIQDKRIEFWETKGSYRSIAIDRQSNKLIGVESVQWDHPLTPSDKNFLNIAWGMRSNNWSVASSNNIVTLFGSSLGGKYKSVDQFENGDFNGWRIYTGNGRYSRILDSIKQGSAINLVLDVLDIDNYSDDGGISFITQTLLVVPDADTIIIKCTPHSVDNQPFMTIEEEFPINTQVGKISLTVFKDPSCLYNIQYRYSSYKEYTEFTTIPSDELIGYYTEVSFTELGNLRDPDDRVRQAYTYTEALTQGFIKLNLSPKAYSTTIAYINKGDLIGVNTITSLSGSLYEIKVGVDKNYQHIIGNISINSDIYFKLNTADSIEGNEFRFHFECESLLLNSKNIYFAQDIPGSSIPAIIKKIEIGDIYMMQNQEKGIVFDFVFDGNSWIMYQNYDLGKPNEIVTLDGVIGNLFDSSGFGKVRGLYGHVLCDGRNGAPNLVDRFILGAGSVGSTSVAVGSTGGAKQVTLTVNQIPAHSHYGHVVEASGTWNGGGDNSAPNSTSQPGNTSNAGGGQPHENMPPYHALIFAKKLF